MSRVQTQITDEMADYIREIALREPEVLRAQRESTDDHPRASMQTSPEQGQFLNLMARLVNAKKTLEIGVDPVQNGRKGLRWSHFAVPSKLKRIGALSERTLSSAPSVCATRRAGIGPTGTGAIASTDQVR